MADLRWWDLEGDPVYCAVALIAAETVDRAIELVIEAVHDDMLPDDPLKRGWHASYEDEDGPQDSGGSGPPPAEGVYFLSFLMPWEWKADDLERLARERESHRPVGA